eukprot:gene34694-biopygen35664
MVVAPDVKGKGRKPSSKVSEASFLGDSDSDDELEVELEPADAESDEMREYISMPDAKADVEVQQWWRDHNGRFPSLGEMTRHFLGVPASTGGVERAFSAVTGMHSDLRKRLEEGTMQHTLMAAMN